MGDSSFLLTLAPWIIYFPAAGFLFQAFFGGRIIRKLGPASGKKVCGTVASAAVAIPFAIAVLATLSLTTIPPSVRQVVVPIGPWIELHSISAPFEVLVDPLSMTMALVVTGVGALIHIYATGYMAEDRDYARFFTYMNLFVTAMLILVLGGNLILMFVGWEGVGLCSYLLIGFWYKDETNVRAGNKAFIFNRIGDVGFTLGIFLVFVMMTAQYATVAGNRTLSFDNLGNTLLLAVHHHPPVVATIAALCLFFGACGKSAQFPLYSWLPDAMAGPTPVSALIHAATMVTAGVYMINRMWPVFAHSPVASTVVACIGAFTALFAAIVAFGQTDIKKVLAYSTVSQLGYMFLACGAGAYGAGVFHLVTHAFFKGLLFLGAGAVIHAMAHNQDMRNYGALRKYMPITTWTMVIACLAIAAFPFTSGFFSKEQILAAVIGPRQNMVVIVAGWAGMATAVLTAVYMVRLTALTFFGKEERWRKLTPEIEVESEAEPTAIEPNPDDPHHFYYSVEEIATREAAMVEPADHAQLGPDFTPHEVSDSMTIPLLALAIPTIVAGFFLGEGRMEYWLYAGGSGVRLHAEPRIPWLPYVGAAAALLGIAFGMLLYMRGLPESEGWDLTKWNPFRRWAGAQFGWDALVTKGGTDVGRGLAHILSDGVEAYVVEGAVDGVGAAVGGFGLLARKLQTGYVRSYAFFMLIGVLALLAWLLYQAGHA